VATESAADVTPLAGDGFVLYARIGRSVQALRKQRGMTQAALASLVGLTRASIVNIERGRQKFLVHTLVQMARALDVPPASFLSEADVSPQAPLDVLLRDKAPAEQVWIRSAMDRKPKKDR
jgi:transcriptional regulator with XRE-family HTH domain